MRKSLILSSFHGVLHAAWELKKQPFGNFMPKRTDIQKILIAGSGPIALGKPVNSTIQ